MLRVEENQMARSDDLELTEIPGLGPTRRAALAQAGVESLDRLLGMSVEELAAIRGIGIWQARKIREFLRQRGHNLEETPDEGVRVPVVLAPPEPEAAAEDETEPCPTILVAVALEADSRELDGAGPEAEDAGRPDTDWAAQLQARREQLPEAALALMDAIRQAAVTGALTRQITRLLITAGEFLTDSRPVSEGQRRRATRSLAETEELIERAVQKRAFGPRAQRDLAARIRRRRKDLEKMLDGKSGSG